MSVHLDVLDARILTELEVEPRVPVLELARRLGVARATVQSRLDRLQGSGVLRAARLDVDLEHAGFAVLAFVRLEIAQGKLDAVGALLAATPEVIEAYGVTGDGDVHCRIACRSHQELQAVLLRLGGSPAVVRTSSTVALSEVVHYRVTPALNLVAR